MNRVATITNTARARANGLAKSDLDPIPEEKHRGQQLVTIDKSKAKYKESSNMATKVKFQDPDPSVYEEHYKYRNDKNDRAIIPAVIRIPGKKLAAGDKIKNKMPTEKDREKQRATGLESRADLVKLVIAAKTEVVREKLTKKLLQSRQEEAWNDTNKKILGNREQIENEIRKNFMDKIQNMQYMGD